MEFSKYKWGTESSGGGGGTVDDVARAAAAAAQTTANNALAAAESLSEMKIVESGSFDLNAQLTTGTYYILSGVTVTGGPAVVALPATFVVRAGDAADGTISYISQTWWSGNGYNYFRGGSATGGTGTFIAWRQNQPCATISNADTSYNSISVTNNAPLSISTTTNVYAQLNISTISTANIQIGTVISSLKRVLVQINNNTADDLPIAITPSTNFVTIAQVDIPTSIPTGQTCYVEVILMGSSAMVKFLGMSS